MSLPCLALEVLKLSSSVFIYVICTAYSFLFLVPISLFLTHLVVVLFAHEEGIFQNRIFVFLSLSLFLFLPHFNVFISRPFLRFSILFVSAALFVVYSFSFLPS